MSFGINDLQNVWSNWSQPQQGQNASLQKTNIASGGNPLQTDQIKLPSWLSNNYNSQMGELTNTYAGIGAAFDPTAQVAARQNAAAYNLSAGTSAANNAATEYANRAAQSGGSSLGAGAVKAQAMMPVLSQNAALKTDAADVAAKSHADAISLASQVAATMANLRTSYLQTLTGYTQGQQQLDLQNRQLQQQQVGQIQGNQLGYAQLAAQVQAQQAAQKLAQQQFQQQTAASSLGPKPSGMYMTDNSGRVTGGQNYYNQLQAWNTAQQSLGGML